MSSSFITYDDVYLILKPVVIDFDMVFLAAFLLLILLMARKLYKTQISQTKYMLVTFLIVVNSIFLPLFIGRINKEVERFSGLTKAEAIKEIISGPEYELYDYLKTSVKPEEKVFLNDVTDPYHENVRAKLRLAYYIAPTLVSDNINDADYVVVVNYENKPMMNIKFPEGKIFEYKKFSDQIAVVKMIDQKKATKEDSQ